MMKKIEELQEEIKLGLNEIKDEIAKKHIGEAFKKAEELKILYEEYQKNEEYPGEFHCPTGYLGVFGNVNEREWAEMFVAEYNMYNEMYSREKE